MHIFLFPVKQLVLSFIQEVMWINTILNNFSSLGIHQTIYDWPKITSQSMNAWHKCHTNMPSKTYGRPKCCTPSENVSKHQQKLLHTSILVPAAPFILFFMVSINAFSCFRASALIMRRSAHCSAVTSWWQATQRVLKFSSLHSPIEIIK